MKARSLILPNYQTDNASGKTAFLPVPAVRL